MDDDDALLRRHGLRLTAQRLAVLRSLADSPHSTADEVHAAVRADLGAVSRQAIYDTLTALTSRHIVRQVRWAGTAARYERSDRAQHHHLICRTCGRIADVVPGAGTRSEGHVPVSPNPTLPAGAGGGFEIDEAEIVYWGRCPTCAEPEVPVGADASSPTRPDTGWC